MDSWIPNSQIATLQYRAELLAHIRQFFKQKKVLEVETPVLSQFATTDVFMDSFSTTQFNKTYYLHTSPEFAMKRLLVSGSGDIYQLAKVFRQEESGHNHNPEFTLLEWYRLDFSEQDLMVEVGELINSLFWLQNQQQLSVQLLSYRQLFLKHLSINPHSATMSELKQCTKKQKLKHDLSDDDDKDRWLELLLSGILEPYLGGSFAQPKMTFLYDYPASQASLARIEKNSQGEKVAKRFELYIAGIELANGFFELDSAAEQLQRFEKDNKQRAKLAKAIVPVDKHLISALEQGLPSCAGVALGIDRLLMLMLKKMHINEVLSFSFERA